MYEGVTFNNLRKALYYLYFGIDYPEEVAYTYIIPMQQNFFTPLKIQSKDTYIQYFITKDTVLTQDGFEYDRNMTYKVAECSLRFVGEHAETWAKFFHHLTQRHDVYDIFMGTCQAQKLEYAGDIYPTPVVFSGKNVHIAFDITFKLYYVESIKLDWDTLENVSLAPGTIN